MTQTLHFRGYIENLIHMGEMGFPSFSIYENIIKENQDKMMKECIEDMINETFESGGSIIEAKGHD
jgi:hypothetical protein